MYKVERKMTNGVWYEVMLSPFKTRQEVKDYYAKYSKYYSGEDKIYRVTNLDTGGMKVIR
jgi:lipocalin